MNAPIVAPPPRSARRVISATVTRVGLVAALVCAVVPTAMAKDLCIEIDSGTFTGSMIVLKKVKLAPQSFGPVHGYFALFNTTFSLFSFFSPVVGQTIVSSDRNLVVGLSLLPGTIAGNGAVATGGAISPISLTCLPGADGKIGVSDTCNVFVVSAGNVLAHTIGCKDAPPIP